MYLIKINYYFQTTFFYVTILKLLLFNHFQLILTKIFLQKIIYIFKYGNITTSL